MKQTDIEKKLKTAGQARMPELVIDDLLTKAEMETPIKKRPEHNVKRLIFAISMCLIFIVAISAVTSQTYYVEAETYLYIDVNPSFEIVVQRNGKVKEVVALNDDAAKAVSDYKFKNTTVEETCDIIFKYLYDNGYIDDNAEIYLSCAGKNNNRANNAFNKSKNTAAAFLNGKNLKANVNVCNGISKKNNNHISPAKQRLIDEIIAMDNNGYSEKELKQMSMKELKDILEKDCQKRKRQ